ncbi:OLD family protein [Acinetobacter sp. ANC 5502]
MFYVTETNETKPPLVKGPFVHLRKDAWNDFSYRTQFYFNYYDENNELKFSALLKIAFDNDIKKQKTDDINELNYIQYIDKSFTKLNDGFFSIGASESYYKELKNLDDDKRIEILTSLNDLAYDLNLYEKVKHLDLSVFSTSLMREYDKEDFVNRIGRIAQGGEVLTSYKFNFNFNDEHNVGFDVEPECFPPTNTHILIGSNGVGKTHFLNTVISEYFSNENNQRSISKLLKLIVVSYSPFDRLFHKVDESLITTRNYSYIGLREDPTLFKVSNFKIGEVIENEFAESLWNCATSLSLRRRWKMMADILSIDNYFKNTELKSFIELINENEVNNKKVIIFPEILKLFNGLSSGHKIIILSLTRLVELTIEKSLILYDEPETFLHPPLISAYMRALSWLLIDRNAVAIIATHSPIILQEVPRKCVWIIQRDAGFYNIVRPDRETFGESVSTLTRDIFNLELRKSGFYKMILDKVEAIIEYDRKNPFRNLKNAIEYFELVMDEFNNEVGDEGQSLILSEIYRQIDEVK